MKNKLTVNTIALANIRQRKKQYAIMIMGIILAMVFSSSIVFFMAAAKETTHAQYIEENGYQDMVIGVPSFSDEDFQKIKNAGAIEDYTNVDILGYVYKNDNLRRMGTAVGRANDAFRKMSNQKLIEGRLPEAENEIAIESEALKKLDYRNATVGSTISLKFDVQNGEGYAKTVDKDYVITGILKDKNSNFVYAYFDGSEYDVSVPAAFVCDNAVLESGGKEKHVTYIMKSEKGELAFYAYLEKHYPENLEYEVYGSSYDGSSIFDYYYFNNGELVVIITLVLVFASCVAIVNSFNNNLKERKKQIGLLRAVGATRRQIIHIFGREAFIISLIVTPISILISYLAVYFGLKLISENAVMTKSIWTLPIAAVINLAVVMLAAMIPLVFASHVSPMQAIRDVRVQRKAKLKKIHSKMQYKPAAHLAKRNGQFYKGSKIAVGIILSVSIIFSAFGFSYISYQKQNKIEVPYDYSFWGGNDTYRLSDTDKQNIAMNPLVKEVRGMKRTETYLKADYSSMFLRVMEPDMFLYNYDEGNEDYSLPTTVEEYRQRIQTGKGEAFNIERLSELGITDDVWTMNIDFCEQSMLGELESDVYDGKIDYNKLRTGEEVILVMPKRAELMVRLYKNGLGVAYNYDDKVGEKQAQYKSVMTQDSPYKVGDEIEIYSQKDKAFKKVKIGALISTGRESKRFDVISTYSPHIITSTDAARYFDDNSGYEELYITMYDKADEKTNKEFMDFMDEYKLKYDGYVSSTYEDSKQIEKGYRTSVAAVLIILIICFAVCASIINNSITAQIRENKRVIGTFRAVGANESELVKSYCIRMLSMFTWGAGIGFGIYIIGFAVLKILYKYMPNEIGIDLVFNPLAAIIMVVVLFMVCLINLWSKIRKEMKNSIVENIREL